MVTSTAELNEIISDFVSRLEPGISVEAIVLFGSYARGNAYEDSVIDVAVISPDFEGVPLYRRQEIIADLSFGRAHGMSAVGYPSSEYRAPGPHSFLREIIRTGKVIYPTT